MDEVSTMKCADSTLSVYGKLPCYAEYIKIRCTDGPGRAFREWLDVAAQGPGARLGTRWRAWTLRPGGETVCAAFRDSADAIGRPFPFSCHASGMTTPATGSLAEQILDASAIWEELEQWDAAIAREKHLDSVRSVALGWRLHGREPATGAGGRPVDVGPLTTFAGRLFAATSGWDAWIGFLWDLRQALLRLRGMTGSVAESRLPALSIPLAPGNDLLAQAWTWARVLDESGVTLPGGAGRGPAIQALAMPSGAVPNAALWLFPRPLVASDYKALPLPAAGILRPAPADRTHDDPAGYSQFRSRLELLMRRDDATMADLASFRLLP